MGLGFLNGHNSICKHGSSCIIKGVSAVLTSFDRTSSLQIKTMSLTVIAVAEATSQKLPDIICRKVQHDLMSHHR